MLYNIGGGKGNGNLQKNGYAHNARNFKYD